MADNNELETDGGKIWVDDVIGDRMKGGGDYPPWWPDDASSMEEGESIVGIVQQIRDDPWFKEDEDDERDTPAPILHVQTQDNLFSTRTHKNLVSLVEDQWDIEVGDLVKIEFAGKYTAEGGTGYNYRMGVIKQSEFDDYDIDPSDYGGTPTHPDPDEEEETSSEPETMEPDEIVDDDEDDDALEDFDDYEADSDGDEDEGDLEEALNFVSQLVDFHDSGELTEEDIDRYLNDTRSLGVDPVDVVEMAGFEWEDTDDGRVVVKDD